LHEYHVDLNAQPLAQAIFDYWQHPRACLGAAELMSNPPLPICIASNIDTADLYAALEYHGWRAPLFVTSETCRAYKPREEMFHAALGLLGVAAQEVLHVGDSISSDVVGAQRAGVDVAWINTRYASLPVPAPTFTLQGIRDLSALL
jgi:2-haloacid dehalogenase/putative hydrolase of the HAD superfamily